MRLHRTIATLLVVSVAGIVTVIGSGTAYACSCLQQPLAAQVASADVAFTGTPTMSDIPQNPTSSAQTARWTFTVDEVHKGTVTRTVDVVSALGSASCGIEFALDRSYLVIGLLDGAAISTNLCDGTVAVDQLPAGALTSLGDGTAPVADQQTAPAQENAAPAEPSGDSGAGPVIAVAFGVVLILAAALLVLWRRSRRAT
jgi:hypothetical protein